MINFGEPIAAASIAQVHFAKIQYENESKEGMDALRQLDYELALAILLPLARDGIPNAQYNVGLLFHRGHWGRDKFDRYCVLDQ